MLYYYMRLYLYFIGILNINDQCLVSGYMLYICLFCSWREGNEDEGRWYLWVGKWWWNDETTNQTRTYIRTKQSPFRNETQPHDHPTLLGRTEPDHHTTFPASQRKPMSKRPSRTRRTTIKHHFFWALVPPFLCENEKRTKMPPIRFC